jgi:hypothetical protein
MPPRGRRYWRRPARCSRSEKPGWYGLSAGLTHYGNQGGTSGSNRLCSSGESAANFDSGRVLDSMEFGVFWIAPPTHVCTSAPVISRPCATALSLRRKKGGQCPQLLRSTRRESAMRLRIAIETSNGTIRLYRPRISRTRARMPARSGGRTRVYAGMRTFISVMPWIRFE